MPTIRVIDFETTGIEPPHQVIEMEYCDYEVETGSISDPVSRLFHVSQNPPETRAIHHIRTSDIPIDAVPFDPFSHIFSDADTSAINFFAAHNAAFEMKFMGDMGHRHMICTYKSALRVWPDAPSHSNNGLRYWLEDQGKISVTHEKAMPPHRAGPDAYVTAHLLKALFADGATGKDMVAWTREPAALPTCPIGDPWRGKKWSEVDHGFLTWMINKAGMEDDYKWNAKRELERRNNG